MRLDDFSDVGQATVLAGEYANKIRYSLATKWLVYDHGVWDENDLSAQGVVQELTSRQLEEADRLIASTWETMTATSADLVMASASSKARGIAKLTPVQATAFQAWDESKNYHKFVLSRRLSRNITATLKEAGPILQVRVRDLDVDPYRLNTPAGTWDLRDGSSHEHNPADLLTKQTAVGPSEEGAQIWADALTVGVRRNVKPELAEARGKRLLIAAETEEGMRLSTSNVKQLASTDQISAEKKFKDPFAFTPSHTLVLYTNHLPRVGAMDAGIWRRLADT